VFHVALRGLFTRKLRSVLSAIAIVLGVAMISGTYVLTDTINGAFSNLFSEIYQGTDVVILRHTTVTTQDSFPPGFPASELAKVAAVNDVKVASGGVQGVASIVGKDGKVVGTGGAPNLGFSIDEKAPQFNTLTLDSGAWPKRGEVVVDRTAAKKGGFKTGDTIGILGNGPVQKMRLSGIVRFGSSNGILGATLAGFELSTAQDLFGKNGQLDYIQVAAKPGVPPANLAREIRSVLPKSYDVRTAAAQVEQQTSETSAGISVFRNFLLVFAGIALFVGAFVIVNSLSITIAQRTREFATLRTLGASRAQVLGSVVIESLVVSAIASVVGLFCGLGLAVMLMRLFENLGLELPQNALAIEPRTIVVSLVVGVAVALLASLRPAMRATRVPPIAAVREGAELPPSRFHRFRTAGSLALTALGAALLLYGLFAHGLTTREILLSLGVGALCVFLGVSFVSARFVTPLANAVDPLGTWAVALLSLLCWPLFALLWLVKRALGRRHEFPSFLPDRRMNKLALENSSRNKQRTASTAAALMIGMAIVTLVAVLATSITSSFKGAVNEIITGDYAITATNNYSPIPVAAAEAAAKAPGVEAVGSVRYSTALVFGKTSAVTAVAGRASQVMKLDWKIGSQRLLDSLGPTGAFVDEEFAKAHHLKLGSPIAVATPTDQRIELKVKGIFKPPAGGSPFESVTFSAKVFDAAFQNPQNEYTLVKMRGGETERNAKALEKALAGFPNAKAQTRQEYIDTQIASLNQVLAVLYVLLAFSVLISFFGIVNTLVLTVFERTRELGMLRAVGMTQRQTKRMIRHESVITALIGAALGIVLGLIFGALLVNRVQYVAFALPTAQLIIFAIAAVVVGVVAAVFPARRAARLNVLEALQYE
jgi:putative ABC transport system permease protein